MAAADSLIQHLDEALSEPAKAWTAENFAALDGFGPSGFDLKRFHRSNKSEFLWDYIASDDSQGIYLVAESEKATGLRDAESLPLKHDFEKLLYVFAPLRLMMCEASDVGDAKRIAQLLDEYAKTCCANFQPGCVFILYCRVKAGKNIASCWQVAGEPQPMSLGAIAFSSHG
jgi:hypothetical protein